MLFCATRVFQRAGEQLKCMFTVTPHSAC